MKLEKDIRDFISLSSSAFVNARAKFTRVLQILTVLTIDKLNDIYDFIPLTKQGLTHLKAEEMARILVVRKDFSADSVRAVQF